jgi:hypothetical protein
MRTLVLTDQSWSADADMADSVDRTSDTDADNLRSFHYGGS